MGAAQRTAEVQPGLVLAGTAVIAVSYGLVRYGYGLYLPEFNAEMHLSSAAVGGIAAGSFGSYCLSAVAAHVLIGRGRTRHALWLACALTCLGAVLVAGSANATVFAVGVLVAGSGAGAASPALVSVVASSVPAEREPRAQARVNSGTGMGVLIGGVVVAVVGDAWRSTWLGFAIGAVLVTRWADSRTTWSARPAPLEAAPTRQGHLRGHLHGLRQALGAALLAGAGSAAVWTFGRELLITTGGVTPSSAGLLWALLGGSGVLGAVSGDLVVRLGLRRAWIGTATACAVGTGVLAAVPGSLPGATLAMALFGGSYVALTGVLIAWGARHTPEQPGMSTATLFLGLTVGQGLGAAVTGLIADHWTPATGFWAAAAIMISALAAAPATR